MFVADFVRFIGSRKLVRVIVNHWIYGIFQGSLDEIHIGYLREMRIPQDGGKASQFWDILKKSVVTSDPLHDPTRYAPTVLFMVDACEHTRDMIDYVRTSTNELYAKRLDGLLAQVDKLIADLNPTKHVDTMKLLMNDFERIPRRIRDAWLADA